MGCILQCLIHCAPLQRYFLRDIGHHYKSCEVVRNAHAQSDTSINQSSTTLGKPAEEKCTKTNICLACEVDRLFLQYFGSSIGRNVARAVCAQPNPVDRYRPSVSPMLTTEGKSSKSEADLRGRPLVTTSILAAAWKASGMDHLAGYEQRDAPEFLHAFLDTVGKHSGEYRKLIQSMRSKARPSNATNETNNDPADIIKELFEGTLRSVLICEECGCKRKIPETFLNVSLPLSKHVDDNATGLHGKRGSKSKISLQQCLGKFIVEKRMTTYSARVPNCIATFRLVNNFIHS
jgi:Ubiquitin carboxyl-terminal hydrolase